MNTRLTSLLREITVVNTKITDMHIQEYLYNTSDTMSPDSILTDLHDNIVRLKTEIGETMCTVIGRDMNDAELSTFILGVTAVVC